jgi:hypothetical protein
MSNPIYLKMKIVISISILIFFVGCNSKEKKADSLSQSDKAKKWLVESIESYFDKDKPEMGTFTTKRYAEYKTDAMNIEFDSEGSLTKVEFEKKWKGIYNTKKAGFDSGFLISAQDWIKPRVTDCNLKSEKGNSIIFEVVIADEGFKAKYLREITLVKESDSFKIDNVVDLN